MNKKIMGVMVLCVALTVSVPMTMSEEEPTSVEVAQSDGGVH